jgi:hypothetical protein
MLSALDKCELNEEAFGRAGRCMIESAVIDSWAKS